MSPLLRVEGLTRHFGGLKAVDDVSFDVEAGRIKAVIGPNGAGKTTTFNLIAGSLRPTDGTVHFDDEELTGLKPHQVAARGVFRTFQTVRLCANMTVAENVMLGRHVRTRAGFAAAMLRLPRTWREEPAVRQRAAEIMELLDIGDLAGAEATTLPFGKQRAVEFARALAAEPRLLLLDEPASGLNIHETEELAGLIQSIRDMGVTIVLVEHDMSLVMEICDEVAVLNFGRKIAEASPAEIQRDPEVVRVYLGDVDAADT
jgi:branched-chain amino acid transport system ATP-binding protein